VMHVDAWQDAEEGRVFEPLFRQVAEVQQRQSTIYDRFIKLEVLYDPGNLATSDSANRKLGEITDNVIASNIDAVTASIASVDVSPRVETDDADWSTQRTARHLEWYAEGLMQLLNVHEPARMAFKEAAKKGAGFVKVWADRFDKIHVEHVFPDDIIVDENETRYGRPARQLHHRQSNVPKDELKAEFPELEDEIDQLGSAGRARDFRRRIGYRSTDNETTIIESWFLPIGRKGKKGYKPGRHVRCADGLDLVDEEWEGESFPVIRVVWEHRAGGYYGISGAERIAGHQLVVNKTQWQIDRQLDQLAVPTTFVRPADANMAMQATKIGLQAVVRGEYPKTIIPPAVSPETYQRLESTKAGAFENFGQSRMAAQSQKPAGLDSGVALREYRDQTSGRFAMQEKAFERFVLDIVLEILAICKKLGDKAPVMLRRSRFGTRKIPWSRVDMKDVRIQLAAASTLSRTPAGRTQQVVEWAQAGVISQDEARRLLQHPDLERAMSIYNEALENIEHSFEEIADGNVVMPEPFMNLSMAVWRGQMQYLIWRDDGAPEDVLSNIRDFVVNAAFLKAGPAANTNSNPNVAAQGPDAGMPAMAAPPQNSPAVAAFSPQAMQLQSA
jgi:hypothetical protein